jgi:hypothetical protein
MNLLLTGYPTADGSGWVAGIHPAGQ